jgi:translation initiation factor IF-3
LIDEDGRQLGIFPTYEALRISKEKGLDLVEISPKANPPVCKIMDFGRYKYQLAKKAHEAKKKQTIVQVKELKLSLKIDDHDLAYKTKRMREFLEDGNKVKVTLMFRGREMLHPQMGEEMARKIIGALRDVGEVEQNAKFDGRNMTFVIAPL